MNDTLEHLFAGRFRTTRLMKQGLGIETFLGVDLANTHDVVVKVARADEDSPAIRTERHRVDITAVLQWPGEGSKRRKLPNSRHALGMASDHPSSVRA